MNVGRRGHDIRAYLIDLGESLQERATALRELALHVLAQVLARASGGLAGDELLEGRILCLRGSGDFIVCFRLLLARNLFAFGGCV